MSRIDWLVLSRLGSRIIMTVVVFYGLIVLVESLNTWRFQYLSSLGGTPLAVLGILSQALRWSIKTLPITVLMGGILGMIDLQSRRELTVIKATGTSIWRMIRMPMVVLFVASIVIAVWGESANTAFSRNLSPSPPGESSALAASGEIWLEQHSGDERYVITAQNMHSGGTVMEGVTLFFTNSDRGDRLVAHETRLENGSWLIPVGTLYEADSGTRRVNDFRIGTTSTPAELRLRLSSTEDLTFFELIGVVTSPVSEPRVLTAALMRLLKLSTFPLLLTGSLFIALAFTAGYRRTNNFGGAIVTGMVLGFFVFIITEMADRAGTSGVLQPAFAALGPALVAIVMGVTVLLYVEDGRI